MHENINMSDGIKKWGAEQPFSVPERYFDDFDARLLKQVSSRKGITPARHMRYRIIAPLIGIAAALLIITLIYNPGVETNGIGQAAQGDITGRIFFNYSPGDFYGDHDLIEVIAEKDLTDIDILLKSAVNSNPGEEELTMLTLFN